MKDFSIISNNCSAAYFYRSINKQFNNPFVWSAIAEADILKALINWNSIHWNNISLYKNKASGFPMVKVDQLFDIEYPHYRYSETDKVPRLVESADRTANIFFCENIKYTEEKYLERMARMPKINPSVLLMHSKEFAGCTDDDMYQIISECEKKSIKVCIISFRQKAELKIKESDLVKWIDIDEAFRSSRIKTYTETLSKVLKEFFEL